MVEFKCEGCGRKLQVEEALASHRVKCPDCGKVMDVPGTNAPHLGIVCNNCGTDLDLNAYAAGTAVPCPKCGSIVLVPTLSGEVERGGCFGLLAVLVVLFLAGHVSALILSN